MGIAYAVFCDRIEKGRPEPHMTYSGDGAREMALRHALWRAESGKVAEVVEITDDDFWKSNWPIVGQES